MNGSKLKNYSYRFIYESAHHQTIRHHYQWAVALNLSALQIFKRFWVERSLLHNPAQLSFCTVYLAFKAAHAHTLQLLKHRAIYNVIHPDKRDIHIWAQATTFNDIMGARSVCSLYAMPYILHTL